MMISPENYIEMMKEKSYKSLLKERDNLIRSIQSFEKNRDKCDEESNIMSSKQVSYMMNLRYLAKLCELILKKHERDSESEKEDETEYDNSVLLENIYKLHTTELGCQRIRKNLSLDAEDVIKWCREKILQPEAKIERCGKNWYVEVDGCKITVNGFSFTVITAHKKK